MTAKRMLQLGEQIREHIATMLVRGNISDPRIKNVTINSVKMSADLQLAKIYFSILAPLVQTELKKEIDAEEELKQVLKGLKSASGYMRRELGKLLLIRYIPELHFYYDDSTEYSVQINSLISRVGKELRENEQTSKAQNDFQHNDNDYLK